MNSSPLISVVLPTYNGARYLNESIQSVVTQSYPHWELLIIDDASSDATPALIADWIKKDSRIRSFRNERNLKLPGSLNQGFRLARGDFLTWTSDDNLYRAGALEQMLEFLIAHPKAGLVYTDHTDIDENGQAIREVHAPPPASLTQGNCVRACFLYPAEVRKKVGDYDETKFLVEDWEYWIRITRQFPLECFHQNLYFYRWHPGSLTTTRRIEINKAIRSLLESNLPQMKWAGRRALAGGYLKLCLLAEEENDPEASLKFFKSAFRYAPIWATAHARRKLLEMICGKKISKRLGSLVRT